MAGKGATLAVFGGGFARYLDGLDLSPRGKFPFHFRIDNFGIDDTSCHGALQVAGHSISWDLYYRSTFRITLSDKGWIGFSRSPHCDARFSARITFDDGIFAGDPLGFGVQGHNCGYRHRNSWTWAHAYLPRPDGRASTVEALVYDMPFGLLFRKAVLWHDEIYTSSEHGVRHYERQPPQRWQSLVAHQYAESQADLRESAPYAAGSYFNSMT